MQAPARIAEQRCALLTTAANAVRWKPLAEKFVFLSFSKTAAKGVLNAPCLLLLQRNEPEMPFKSLADRLAAPFSDALEEIARGARTEKRNAPLPEDTRVWIPALAEKLPGSRRCALCYPHSAEKWHQILYCFS